MQFLNRLQCSAAPSHNFREVVGRILKSWRVVEEKKSWSDVLERLLDGRDVYDDKSMADHESISSAASGSGEKSGSKASE